MLHAVDIFFYLLEMLILVRILLSWIVGYQGGSVMRLLYNLTEPILQPVRNMVDKSPLGGGVGLFGLGRLCGVLFGGAGGLHGVDTNGMMIY